MEVVVGIVVGIAALIFLGLLIFSKTSDPKERVSEAGGAAVGGAAATVGCMLQCILAALPILIGFWLLRLIFG